MENKHIIDVDTLPEGIDDDMRYPVWLFHRSSHPDCRDTNSADPPRGDSDETDENYIAAIGIVSRLRRKLLGAATYLTHEGAAYVLSSDEGSPCSPEEVVERRNSGEILGVSDHGQWLYPDFQFKDGKPSPFMQEAHQHFCEIMNNTKPDRWHTLDFFLGHYRRLGGQTIASCLWNEARDDDIRFIIENTRI
ncbi:MAG: hypothetical protein Q4F02_00825 [Candidatus Saccharibacteria bacterium]|nr:hypothetical protein [Candidatus Saccharibacteria bacterium]